MANPNSQLYLGVDGGATKTTAVVIGEDKNILGQGTAAGSNANVLGFEKAIINIKVAIDQVLNDKTIDDLTAAYLAISGINSPDDKSRWRKAIASNPELSQLPKLTLVNDTQAALRAGTDGKNAIVIIAGTGSNCYGRNVKGQEAKSGSQDYLLADEGSAYAIGTSILHKITQSLDGRGQKTVLTDLLFEKYKINSLRELSSLVYKKPWNKSDIAAVAPLLEEALSQKDLVAQNILDQTVFDLASMIRAVAQSLEITSQKFNVVTTGSVFKVKQIQKGLKEKVLKFAANAKFTTPKVNSAVGAAYLARDSVHR